MGSYVTDFRKCIISWNGDALKFWQAWITIKEAYHWIMRWSQHVFATNSLENRNYKAWSSVYMSNLVSPKMSNLTWRKMSASHVHCYLHNISRIATHEVTAGKSVHTTRLPRLRGRSRSHKESEVCGWSRILATLGVGVGFFSRIRMSNWIMFYITLQNWEFLLKWCNFFWPFVDTEISCCASRYPLILTAKFYSLYVKESESENLQRSESGVAVGYFGKSESRIFYLRLRNPAP